MNERRDGSGEFLSGKKLGERIREVTSGEEVCCAIAFWSEDGVAEIFPNGMAADAKVVCDISMGATSASALLALDAPRNKRLRHQIGMHAKVCLSNRGLVISSANASRTAMGSGAATGHHLEAGTFHAPDSRAWGEATAWFNDLYRRASPVGDDEIAWAKLVYRPQGVTKPPREGSLLDRIIAAPEKFEKIGFVFATSKSTEEDIAEVRAHLENLDSSVSKRAQSLSSKNVFSGWSQAEAKRWPTHFVEFWQPSERLSVFGHRLDDRLPDIGSILSVTDWRGLEAAVGMKLPSRRDVEKIDAALALLVRGSADGVFFASGPELKRRLDKLKLHR
jgi:hypothetical protein